MRIRCIDRGRGRYRLRSLHLASGFLATGFLATGLLATGLLATGAALLAAGPAAADNTWAPRLDAVYKLRLLGMEMATFNFGSQVKGDTYALAGHTKMTWGMGYFKFAANFSSTGKISGESVRPTSYTYDWQANKKQGSVKLVYGNGAVQSVQIEPPHTQGPDVVPLKPEHLRGVLDPLSVLMVLSRAIRGGDPCNRKVAVFEGKQRFDVIFSPKGEETIKEAKPSGQPVKAFVCNARYVPVAGHKMNKETTAAVKAEGIEVAFRPIPEANVLVPYRITLPTPAGTAVLTAHKVDISAPGNRRIALTH